MTLGRGELVARYTAFAAVSTAVNLGVQHLSLVAYAGPLAVAVSILAGTGAGFLCKYGLDKRFIFFDARVAALHEAGRIALYGATGVVTTLVFWACEIGLWRAVGADWGRDVGAVIGLAIGYWAKYQLDRRFVFPAAASPC
jgi:putative flippase GtrA